MAVQKRVKAPSFTTPKGTFKYPKISAVDFGSKEFPNPEGVYALDLILKASDQTTIDFIAKLQPLYEQAMQNAEVAFKTLKAESRKKLGSVKQNPLYTELLDPDTEAETGEIAFRFKMKASGEYKKGLNSGKTWDSRPAIFGPKGELLVPSFRFQDREDGQSVSDAHPKVKPDIWGGTIGKVSFDVGLNADGEPGYFISGTGAAGLSLGLKAVQVIDLVSGGQRTAKDHGFGDETDGEEEAAEEAGADTADF